MSRPGGSSSGGPPSPRSLVAMRALRLSATKACRFIFLARSLPSSSYRKMQFIKVLRPVRRRLDSLRGRKRNNVVPASKLASALGRWAFTCVTTAIRLMLGDSAPTQKRMLHLSGLVQRLTWARRLAQKAQTTRFGEANAESVLSESERRSEKSVAAARAQGR